MSYLKSSANTGLVYEDLHLNKLPDRCPLCHTATALQPHMMKLTGDKGSLGTFAELVFQCPVHECARLFIGRYKRYECDGSGKFCLVECTPGKPVPPEVHALVANVSPAFKEIFQQASEADDRGMSEIAGGGYRKALEFLVKDFCSSRTASDDEKEAIKSKPLWPTIKDHIEDEKLKQCARRAAWLGNDEIHYYRKWEDKDISDLRALLNLTMLWVARELETEQYLEEMPE